MEEMFIEIHTIRYINIAVTGMYASWLTHRSPSARKLSFVLFGSIEKLK